MIEEAGLRRWRLVSHARGRRRISVSRDRPRCRSCGKRTRNGAGSQARPSGQAGRDQLGHHVMLRIAGKATSRDSLFGYDCASPDGRRLDHLQRPPGLTQMVAWPRTGLVCHLHQQGDLVRGGMGEHTSCSKPSPAQPRTCRVTACRFTMPPSCPGQLQTANSALRRPGQQRDPTTPTGRPSHWSEARRRMRGAAMLAGLLPGQWRYLAADESFETTTGRVLVCAANLSCRHH